MGFRSGDVDALPVTVSHLWTKSTALPAWTSTSTTPPQDSLCRPRVEKERDSCINGQRTPLMLTLAEAPREKIEIRPSRGNRADQLVSDLSRCTIESLSCNLIRTSESL